MEEIVGSEKGEKARAGEKRKRKNPTVGGEGVTRAENALDRVGTVLQILLAGECGWKPYGITMLCSGFVELWRRKKLGLQCALLPLTKARCSVEDKPYPSNHKALLGEALDPTARRRC